MSEQSVSQPPLPPGPPPPQVAAASHSVASPLHGPTHAPQPPPLQAGYFQPAPGYGWDGGYQHGYEPSMPPVAQLLMREAQAWTALLNLHTGVLGTARQMASSMTESDPTLETAREAIEVRESSYYAALSQLASHCDALGAEALRLRALRKTRATTDTQALQALMQSHSCEALAIGSTLAGSSAIAVNTTASELRQASTSTREQIAQVRALMQVVQDAPALQGRLSIRVDNTHTFSPSEVFDAVYHQSDELSDEALSRALAELCRVEEPNVAAPTPERTNTRVRRASDRGATR
jgi:hypothetical protein